MNQNQFKFENVKGILSDIDGTLYFKEKPVAGAREAIKELRKKGIKLLFFTNTDSKSPETILNLLREYGFEIYPNELFTPIIALKEYLTKRPERILFLLTTREIKNEFHDFTILEDYKDSIKPDFVIVGDFHDNWDVHRLNDAFKYVLKGSKLLGTQGNRYYLDKNGDPTIDTGSFINLIAGAAGVEPTVFGKPTRAYFIQALKKIELKAEEVIVIGDDIESDIQGAINANIKAILVKTGKGALTDLEKVSIKPYKVIESFSSIVSLIWDS